MTSTRRLEANRRNARASTEPRTAAGKARAARNARRHGLSIPTEIDPVRAQQLEAVTGMIAGEGASSALREQARAIADAQMDLGRVREVRQSLLMQTLQYPKFESLLDINRPLKPRDVMRLIAPETSAAVSEPEKFIQVLSKLTKQPGGLERYEIEPLHGVSLRSTHSTQRAARAYRRKFCRTNPKR
jgi:hypothetical protein